MAEDTNERRKSEFAGEDLNRHVDGTPRSTVTGRHDAGSGANETIDGLDSNAEELRRAAEDTPSGERPKEDVPVFERGDLPPKI